MRELVSVTRRQGHAHYHLAEPHLKKMVQCLESCVQERKR